MFPSLVASPCSQEPHRLCVCSISSWSITHYDVNVKSDLPLKRHVVVDCCMLFVAFLDAMKRSFWFRSFEDSTTLSIPQENGLAWKSLLSRTRVYRQSKILATEYSRVRWREGLTNTLRLLAKSRWRVCLLRSPNKLVGKTKFVA